MRQTAPELLCHCPYFPRALQQCILLTCLRAAFLLLSCCLLLL
jgi:hypothetical protein